MQKYSLSYDVKASLLWKPDEFKENLVKLLIENGAVSLQNPTASTILFEDENEEPNIHFWNGKLLPLKNDMYYYLSIVAVSEINNQYLDRYESDKFLNQNFQDLIRKF